VDVYLSEVTMSEPDVPQGGDLGAVVISFVILLATMAMTFVAYYVLMDLT
jgi:hypothetical protein